MLHDHLAQDLYTEICRVPIIDPHSHIDPRRPTARSLDDILGYHYYTELAHSAGMTQAPLAAGVEPRRRSPLPMGHLDRLHNNLRRTCLPKTAPTLPCRQGRRPAAPRR